MNAWPDVNGDAIGRYLRQLRLRTSHTARIYRGILAGFQRLAEQRGDLEAALAAWKSAAQSRV